jgi:predicted carbohydrate-binding protein with CBM5 and CBM33 domain
MKLVSIVSSGLSLLQLVTSHGALSFPPARQWMCSGQLPWPIENRPHLGVTRWGENGANVCKHALHTPAQINDVIFSWAANLQFSKGRTNEPRYQANPKQPHIDVMVNVTRTSPQSICSTGNPAFAALDNDQWTRDQGDGVYPTFMTAGDYEFEFSAAFLHNFTELGYMETYITKAGWDSSKPLKFDDLEDKPFCRREGTFEDGDAALDKMQVIIPPTGKQPWGFKENRMYFDCTVPERPSGENHIIYFVWHRADRDEAFYSCSDVIFKKPTGMECSLEAANLPKMEVSMAKMASFMGPKKVRRVNNWNAANNNRATLTFKPNLYFNMKVNGEVVYTSEGTPETGVCDKTWNFNINSVVKKNDEVVIEYFDHDNAGSHDKLAQSRFSYTQGDMVDSMEQGSTKLNCKMTE